MSEAYERSLDPEVVLPGSAATFLRAVVGSAGSPVLSGLSDIGELLDAAAYWGRERRSAYAELVDSADEDARQSLLRRSLLACAPLMLCGGGWLQCLPSMALAEDPATLRLLRVYASDVGVGEPLASRGKEFLRLLLRHGLAEHASPAADLIHDRRVGEYAFELATQLLLMGRAPRRFRDEVVGADLLLRAIGRVPALEIAAILDPASRNVIDLATARGGRASPAEVLEDAVELGDFEPARLVAGARWAFAEATKFDGLVRHELEATLDPAFDLMEMLRSRAAEGAMYHHGYRIAGEGLAELLRGAVSRPARLVDALARSPLIRPGEPERSALLTLLVAPDGPMFRVFSPSDLAIFRRWIKGLSGDGHPRDLALPSATEEQVRVPWDASVDALVVTAPRDLADAYHQLLFRDDTAELRAWAVSYVDRWLARSATGLDKSEGQLPVDWPSEGLSDWLSKTHAAHAREFAEQGGGTIAAHDELIDSSTQLGALTMIDGAWLHGFSDYELASSPVGFALFETYWDELGNGDENLNHPRIFRDLLAEMGVQVPATSDPQFPRSVFRPESLELPVYWLALGRLPVSRTPEILGMNLAMELSGVGGSYRRAKSALAAHGFSTRFVDIHNTIDNVASGHSAWAAAAIERFLAGAPTGDRPHLWARVRVGYRSLNPPARTLAVRVAERQGYQLVNRGGQS